MSFMFVFMKKKEKSNVKRRRKKIVCEKNVAISKYRIIALDTFCLNWKMYPNYAKVEATTGRAFSC